MGKKLVIKEKKAFTLIELLAVIVILAIIALIAVPIILNIIGDAKKQSNLRSAELYVDAVEKSIARYSLSSEFPDTTCIILNGGNLNCENLELPNPFEISMENSNQIKSDGIITFKNGKIDSLEGLNISETLYKLENGRLIVMDDASVTKKSCFTYADEFVTYDIDQESCISSLKNELTNYDIYVSDDDVTSLCSGGSARDITLVNLTINPDIYNSFKDLFILNEQKQKISNNGAYITGYDASCGTDVVIPNIVGGKKVTGISTRAFYNKNLTSVTIPETVERIGPLAFSKNQLTSVTLPNRITEMNYHAFSNNELTDITIPNSVTAIGYSTFTNNELTDITIPNSVTRIGGYAFSSNQLTNVNIPNSVTTIELGAFGQNQLTAVIIPNSVTTIGNYAFTANQLIDVSIPNSVTTIEPGVFSGNHLTSVTIPDSVTTIGTNAFEGNKLTSIIIPNSVTTIGNYAFSNFYCGRTSRGFACSSSTRYFSIMGLEGTMYGPNAFTSVTINGKSKLSDFKSYGTSVFGWVKGKSDSNITWKPNE